MPPLVSQPIRRVEDPVLLRGEATFVDDLAPPRTLTAVFARSDHAHARLRRVDVSAARRQPGVVAAWTGEDLRRVTAPIPSRLHPPTFRRTEWPALAVGKVRFVGEALAIVLAGGRYAGEDALEHVRVEYEPLPAVVDVDASMAAGAPRLHEQHPDNVLLHLRHDNGRVDEAFARADVVLREAFRLPRASAAPIENRGVLASPDRSTGLLT